MTENQLLVKPQYSEIAIPPCGSATGTAGTAGTFPAPVAEPTAAPVATLPAPVQLAPRPTLPHGAKRAAGPPKSSGSPVPVGPMTTDPAGLRPWDLRPGRPGPHGRHDRRARTGAGAGRIDRAEAVTVARGGSIASRADGRADCPTPSNPSRPRELHPDLVGMCPQGVPGLTLHARASCTYQQLFRILKSCLAHARGSCTSRRRPHRRVPRPSAGRSPLLSSSLSTRRDGAVTGRYCYMKLQKATFK